MAERNYGIDFLRIISTFMVINLHVLLFGGILDNIIPLSINYEIAWFIEIACLCAVNCYALISGYVGFESSFHPKNLINLWFITFFYQTTIAVFFYILSPNNYTFTDVIKFFFPVLSPIYWYFIAYFGAFFFFPIWNYLIDTLSFKKATCLILSILILFSILPTACRNDPFFTNEGYSFLWLSLLYIIGAYIKKYISHISLYKAFLLYLINIFLTWFSKLFIQLIGRYILGTTQDGAVLTKYTSPTILFSGIALLLLFSKLSIPDKMHSMIKTFSSMSFGIFIIHVHPLIHLNVLKDQFIHYVDYNPINFLVSIILTSLLIYFFCSIIEYIRILIFKYLHINQISQSIEKYLMILFAKIFGWIQFKIIHH